LTSKGEYFIDPQNLSESMCKLSVRINGHQKGVYW